VLNPKTFGEHLKKRRHLLGQLQREAAAAIGVSMWTYLKWEDGRAAPSLRLIPKAMRYLGYDPTDAGWSYAAWVTAARRRLGISRLELASLLGLNVASVQQWEEGVCRPRPENQAALEQLLGKPADGRG
jgi:transcriptional regulator with XRE-family HTH domain